MENAGLNFAEFLGERIKDSGLNLKKLSEVSGIAFKHLEEMAAGNLENLPSAPYFRGYLIRLGKILNFDPEPWWNELKASGAVRGAHTPATKNRFEKKSLPPLVWLGALAAVILIYILSQLPRITGKPEIAITSPGQNPAIVSQNGINLAGYLKNGGSLYINGEETSIDKNGGWSKTVLLQTGINTLQVTAKKFLGGETNIMEQIIYEPPLDVSRNKPPAATSTIP